ncbi:MAG: cofactor-independent phosphoglycerate mutase [Firmicutes bacterium HGW-Firmicutes-3]|jgi:2,3-bisphosphoglycerate-independent phosphoglycerate mutase|nr:MAG: cofactor-independent phosphoglycerate mutase [Firmicutes bacterium HGW-Firmicutes-3]
MKYVVILGDGMADRPIARLGNKTPLQVAKKPNIDALAMKGEVALVDTIPKGMAPGSDTANLSVMGYNPKIYYTGRSPLEAVSMGINMEADDICFRCNLVTLSEKEPYEDKMMLDHSASEITTEEAGELIAAIDQVFSDTIKKFYPGISYRHALIWKKGSLNVELVPPHNILESSIKDYLPKGDFSDLIMEMQKTSYALLNDHPINLDRAKRKLNKANSIWIWGEGTKPSLTSFREKYGKKGAMVSAVDLLKGIAIASEMTSIDVEGADGTLHTNYEGKVKATLEALKDGHDFVYLHIEAPDECGHRGELENKILAIELIDEKVVKPIVKGLTELEEPYRILIMPDHPTPVEIRTHTTDPVPYLLYDSRRVLEDYLTYDEVMAEKNGVRFEEGHELMGYFLAEE